MKANFKRGGNIVVMIGDKSYEMSKEVLKAVLDTAKESVPNGVYAAKNNKAVILLNEPNITDERFKELCRDFNKKGFILLHNRGSSDG